MKILITRLTIATSLIFLAACGGGGSTSSSSSSSSSGGQTLTLATAFGHTIDVTPTNLPSIDTECFTESSTPNDGIQDTISIVDTTMTSLKKTYTGDTKCTGTASTTKTFKATLSVDQDTTVTNWIDGTGMNTTPPAKAGHVALELPTNPPYTQLNMTITESDDPDAPVGTQQLFGYVIDDSHDNGIALWRVNAAKQATTADPYTNIVTNGYATIGFGNSSIQTYTDNTDTSSVTAIYDSTKQEAMIRVDYTNGGASAASYLKLVLPFDFSTGNHLMIPDGDVNAANSIDATYVLDGVRYNFSKYATSYITITSSGINEGDPIIGNYNVLVCSATNCPDPATYTNNIVGDFVIKRGANR